MQWRSKVGVAPCVKIPKGPPLPLAHPIAMPLALCSAMLSQLYLVYDE